MSSTNKHIDSIALQLLSFWLHGLGSYPVLLNVDADSNHYRPTNSSGIIAEDRFHIWTQFVKGTKEGVSLGKTIPSDIVDTFLNLQFDNNSPPWNRQKMFL